MDVVMDDVATLPLRLVSFDGLRLLVLLLIGILFLDGGGGLGGSTGVRLRLLDGHFLHLFHLLLAALHLNLNVGHGRNNKQLPRTGR
jgi:hypothetical protein